jgi:hypothetical protein
MAAQKVIVGRFMFSQSPTPFDKHLGSRVNVEDEKVQIEVDGRDAIVTYGILEPNHARDSFLLQGQARLVPRTSGHNLGIRT